MFISCNNIDGLYNTSICMLKTTIVIMFAIQIITITAGGQ